MPHDPVQALMLDLLEWVRPAPRLYSEVIDAWRTSCPRLPVWETADELGYLERIHSPGQTARVRISSAGLARLEDAKAASTDATRRDRS
jgi:D-3-phosphoglycerate dehydrogenase / 2-oxoglutarate reductase